MLNADEIVKAEIYPPIGLARVGNASIEKPDGFYFASEVAGKMATDDNQFRNANRELKRQAVKFRIYVTMSDGSVHEVSLQEGVDITWRVNVANLKAGWYKFIHAMDLPDGLSKPTDKRNADKISPEDRSLLDITPSPRSISGISKSGSAYRFDDGEFMGKRVNLGEIRTDTEGRLIFIGGEGHSEPEVPGTKPKTFANNDGWHDDTCDGTVRASLVIDGKSIDVVPAYVAVAPPNYGHGLFSVVTMDDVVQDLYIKKRWIPEPQSVSFNRDIWPIFSRLSDLSWTNHGIYMLHGTGSPIDARSPEVIDKLRDASLKNKAWRKRVSDLFRSDSRQGRAEPNKIPPLYGDAFGEPIVSEEGSVLEGLELTSTMFKKLKMWAEGEFIDDWTGAPPVKPTFEDLSAKEQIHHLERAALEECLGGPFHPGIELTWILRNPLLWDAPYRLKILDESIQSAPQDYGEHLTSDICLSPRGPLDGVAPGSLTRWLGVPWQTDEASCNSDAEYAPSLYLSLPSYWGARVPNQVMSSEAWSRVSDSHSPILQRMKHLSNREDWLRDIAGKDYYDRIDNMVNEWWNLGVLIPEDTTDEERSIGLPDTVYIESGRDPEYAGSNAKLDLIETAENINQPELFAHGMVKAAAKPFVPPKRTYKRGEV
ncbi:MAG: LodA/GoxA family CTQ-dependent oxidase [Cellvibrionales bacterium]|nr:LodA/GoxA family CTQ-dependent oxidase [Cellvibrionales bacterium]